METILKPFDYKEELILMYNDLKTIQNINLNINNDEMNIIVNNSKITIYYDNCFHLFIKSNNLDSELITSESSVKNDILHLIKLYS